MDWGRRISPIRRARVNHGNPEQLLKCKWEPQSASAVGGNNTELSLTYFPLKASLLDASIELAEVKKKNAPPANSKKVNKL